jgi:hypothetical protein
MLSTLGAPTLKPGSKDVGMYDLETAMSILSELSGDSFVPDSGWKTDYNPTDHSVTKVDDLRRDVEEAIAGLTEDEFKSNITAQLEFCRQLAKDLDQLALDRVLARCEKTSNSETDKELGVLYRTVTECAIALLAEDPKAITVPKGGLNADNLLAAVLERCLPEQMPWTNMQILGIIALVLSAFAAILGGLCCMNCYDSRRGQDQSCFPWCDRKKIREKADAVWGLLHRRSQPASSGEQGHTEGEERIQFSERGSVGGSSSTDTDAMEMNELRRAQAIEDDGRTLPEDERALLDSEGNSKGKGAKKWRPWPTKV